MFFHCFILETVTGLDGEQRKKGKMELLRPYFFFCTVFYKRNILQITEKTANVIYNSCRLLWKVLTLTGIIYCFDRLLHFL